MVVSAVILTRDEADHLVGALESVGWCDEVLVVDSYSTDRTREIATTYDARIIDAPKRPLDQPYDHFRQIGVEAATNNLVLLLDADEVLTAELQQYLKRVTSGLAAQIKVVRAPVVNYVGGELLARGWPNYKPLIVRRNAVGFKQDVHDFLRIDGKPVDDVCSQHIHDVPATDKLTVQHRLAQTVGERWRSQRRYARIAGASRDFSVVKLLLAPLWGFYHRVIEQQGWRDGITGVTLGLCYSWFLFETQLRAGLRTRDTH